jgi:carboxylesterase type B
MEYSFIQHALPKPDFPGTSETLGLNLIITIPESPRQPTHRGNLPVLVFLHGGGFAIGSNWWPQYDFSRLVKLASRKGQPVIGVNVNYRLGALGFMTTPELRAAGYQINNGLRDQRVALQWVKEYISGFGGNPQNVTVMGESAGGGESGQDTASSKEILIQCPSVCWISTVVSRATGKSYHMPGWLPSLAWTALSGSR